MTFNELYKRLSELHPETLRCDWDNDGIMCADSLGREVRKVLVSLDVTMDTVNYATENGYDTVVSHHPLVFRSQKSLTPLSYTQNKLIRLIKGNVGVMSFHTRLDASNGGVNDVLVSLLGLENVYTDPTEPIGRIGYLKAKTELSTFAENVKSALNPPFVLYSGNKEVSKVYAVGGDGKDLIENAISNGCDTIITGRASYNTANDACDMGINIVEAGHFYTEHPVCNALKAKISELVPEAQVDVYNSNKINFC